MENKSLGKLGGICSIFLGISYILVGITYFFRPAEQKPGVDAAQYLLSMAENQTPALLNFWFFAIGALFAIAAVAAISELVRSQNEGWVRWMSTLAYIGFAVTIIGYLQTISLIPGRADAYVAGDASTRAAIAALSGSSLSLDPNGWIRYGLPGLWIFVVGILALRGDIVPKILAYLGIIGAICYWLIVAGYLFHVEVLVAISAGLGGVICGPIFFIWMGLILRRESS